MIPVLPILIFLTVVTLLEVYGWQVVKTAIQPQNLKQFKWIYWGATIFFYALFFSYRPFLYKYLPHWLSVYYPMFFLLLAVVKLIAILFLLPEDMVRVTRFAISKITGNDEITLNRSQFLSRLALGAAALPVGTLLYGMIANAYNYRFHRITLKFPNLPAAFDGMKLIQLSDIHSGSFTQSEPIKKVIEKINEANADVIVFTGDLVNNVASEMDDYLHVFAALKAKHGVYSITGNHDYGDYVEWGSEEDKKENFDRFKSIHHKMGWDLLMNEHRVIEKAGEKIALIGIENWGTGRWTKYGKMDVAHKGTNDIPFKILLSHNPQHWDAQVRPQYPDVDLTLSGHTHGAQLGVEEKWLRWSPVQYIYKQWAGLYQEGKQYLYVNRGFGFLFYPGRVGILPEVTEITLKRA